ncbi:MAG: hypothetical protein HYU77_15360 [Betaproteobacteria bacterium]|nr:hypothetical protein [Betaproteobacteria bacterium]
MAGPDRAPGKNWLGRVASLKFTLAILVLLGIGVALSYQNRDGGWVTWLMVGPLALFALNLIAAIATHPTIRTQAWLLIFHLALLAIILLVAAGRLTYLKGAIELTEGEVFGGELTRAESGLWHWWRLDRVRFVNQGFTINYAPGVQREHTYNRVRWVDEHGIERTATIGDQTPLVLYGYRFYTSFNKGFAPVFSWYPAGGGAPRRGSVHLPSYPAKEFSQAQGWTLPGNLKVWAMLQIDEVILDRDKASRFRAPEKHRLVLRIGDDRHELRPGGRVALPQGVLVYEGLRAWMGYRVFSDWTLPWLLASCALAVVSLALHFWRKFSAKPWSPA